MTRMARAFVAVVPPPAVLAAVESLIDSVSAPDDALRWARRDQWHLTLQFLGRVTESDPLTESLTESVRRMRRFPARLGGGGAFPSTARGSVLWLGLAAGHAELTDLSRTVHAATARLGFAADARTFRPHVTLARAPNARHLGAAVAALGDRPVGPQWTVDHVVLIESDTRPDGAVYTTRARFALDEPCG